MKKDEGEKKERNDSMKKQKYQNETSKKGKYFFPLFQQKKAASLI